MADSPNTKTGYMVKQGGRIKTWKRRWFVLERKNKVLKYFRKPEDELPKGNIHIEGYQVGDADEVVKKSFAFMISKEGFRTYYIYCEDLATKNDWMSELREASKPSPKGGATPINHLSQQFDDDSEPSEDEEPTLRRPNQIAHPGFEEQTVFDPRKTTTNEQTLVNRYDANATLVGYSSPTGTVDPNATLISDFHDPNATLIGDGHPRAADPNATLIGSAYDANATLIGGDAMSGFAPTNHSAKIRSHAQQQPQIVPHLRMIPYNTYFPVVERNVLRTLKFGRKSDENSDPDFVAFDSKVVSRRHAEVWVVNGDFYIRDTKSQSGTFLNAMRLSLPGEESKPFKLKNGDTVQFGVDLRNNVEANTKCVSVTIELSFIKVGEPAPAPAPSGGKPLNMSDLTLVSGAH